MTVTFTCGTRADVNPDRQQPRCPHCGTRRVRSSSARAPRFRGTVSGPSATAEALPAMPVSFGGGE